MVKDYSFLNGFKEVNWLDLFIRPLLDKELVLLNRLKEIVCNKVLVPDVEDRLIWVHDNKGEFSVKKLSKLLIEGVEDISFDFDKIWKLKVPPRVRSFIWMISIDRIRTKDFLSRRGLEFSNLESCPWCNNEQEKVEHFFFRCKFIKGFWRKIFKWWDTKWFPMEGSRQKFMVGFGDCGMLVRLAGQERAGV
ncbi:LINE-1 reverse transcriptase like [Gossypium australe]|uniref:LINE-1 reverse transcriptase like n=1 Tax=Gossypium australe TaxID=47621 RepID=A0A5B6WF72_9ROSI|nr:LINE-1 reverse transcriptase like [Gossypium australe]